MANPTTRPTVHLLVGLPCSGKSAFAVKLASSTGAYRLTPDEWQIRLFGNDTTDPDHDHRHSQIEDIMWDIAGELVIRGLDVIMDFGFWTAEEREQVARRVVSLGAEPAWYYLDTPTATIRARLVERNQDPSYTLKIPPPMMEEWITVFEAPTINETLLGPLTCVTEEH